MRNHSGGMRRPSRACPKLPIFVLNAALYEWRVNRPKPLGPQDGTRTTRTNPLPRVGVIRQLGYPSSETDLTLLAANEPQQDWPAAAFYSELVHRVARLLVRSAARFRGVRSVGDEKLVVPFSPVADNLDVRESTPGDRARMFGNDDLEAA